MKRFLSLLLLVVMCSVLFVGCDSKVEEGGKEVETKQDVEVGGDGAEIIDNGEDNGEVSKGEDETDEDDKKKDEKGTYNYYGIECDIDNIEIYNKDGIVITAKEFDLKDGNLKPTLTLVVKNDTEYDLDLKLENVTINRYMMKTTARTPDGVKIKKSTTGDFLIEFEDNCILNQRIKSIAEIDFDLKINCTVEGNHSGEKSKNIEIGKLVIKTGLEEESYPEIMNRKTVVEQNGLKIEYIGMSDNNSTRYMPSDKYSQLFFYIENTNTDEINFALYDGEVRINDKKIDAIFSYKVLPNKRVLGIMEIENKKLREKDISVINTLVVNDLMCINEKTGNILFKDYTFTLENLSETLIDVVGLATEYYGEFEVYEVYEGVMENNN